MPPINPPKQNLPQSFDALIALLPLGTLRDDRAHEHAVEMIDQLMRIEPMSPGQERYLRALLDIVEAYEQEHHTLERDAPDKPLAA